MDVKYRTGLNFLLKVLYTTQFLKAQLELVAATWIILFRYSYFSRFFLLELGVFLIIISTMSMRNDVMLKGANFLKIFELWNKCDCSVNILPLLFSRVLHFSDIFSTSWKLLFLLAKGKKFFAKALLFEREGISQFGFIDV